MSMKYVENLDIEIEEADEDEVTNVPEQEKKEEKLPDPIIFKTASGEGILLTATSVSSYNKAYYTDYNKMLDEFNSSPAYLPRRVKDVKLPQSRDGIAFRKTWDLFVHLTANCGYKRIRNHK